MLRRLSLAALGYPVVPAVLLFTACGSETPSSSSPPTAEVPSEAPEQPAPPPAPSEVAVPPATVVGTAPMSTTPAASGPPATMSTGEDDGAEPPTPTGDPTAQPTVTVPTANPDGSPFVGAAPSATFATLDPNDPPQIVQLSGNLGTHDPVIIQSPGGFHEFDTGTGIDRKFSTDLVNWQPNGRVYQTGKPAWINAEVPDHTAEEGDRLWAPDVSFFGGQYHLYYSVSTFGSQDSCIGHATTDDLDSGVWVDSGAPLFCSEPGDAYNAIDPNVAMGEGGTPWLSFGSHWDGIFIFDLDLDGNRAGSEVQRIATVPGTRIEAPYIVSRGGFFYLFASYDACCAGLASTYNVRVTRATSIIGPYVDQGGTQALAGGGLRLLSGIDGLEGPGHNGIVFTDDQAYIVFHAYPGPGATLRISELAFDAEGWPVTVGP